MSVIVKIKSVALGRDSLLAINSIWNYSKQTVSPGDEVFVWFTRAREANGLAMRGTLEQVAPAGISANGRQLVSLSLKITDSNPRRPFTIAALRPHKGSTAPGALPRLAHKLLMNSHQKLVLLDEEETQHLGTYFGGPAGGLSEQVWREFEREASLRARSTISARIRRDIGQDLRSSALEGLSQEQRIILRSRAAWLAARFARQRWDASELRCDECGFDPSSRVDGTAVNPRFLMDVHHRDPLAEGVRVTGLADFQLLCPNCHRFAHAVIRNERR
jgi:hypothetical protein